VEASKAKSLGARIKTFAKIRPRDLVPVSPAIAEPSTGESMGQSAEKMAKENHISREAQDRWALRSHKLAAQGTADGRLTAEIVPWLPTRLVARSSGRTTASEPTRRSSKWRSSSRLRSPHMAA